MGAEASEKTENEPGQHPRLVFFGRPRILRYVSFLILLGGCCLFHYSSFFTRQIPTSQPPIDPQPPQGFRLRQIYHHGTGADYRVHRRLDISAGYLARHHREISLFRDIDLQDDQYMSYQGQDILNAIIPVKKSLRKLQITRLRDRHVPNFLDLYFQFAMTTPNKKLISQIALDWVDEEEDVPDMSDRDTLLSLATMLLNAYVRLPKNGDKDSKSDWVDLGDAWHADPDHDMDFGWDETGVRGHVFVNHNESAIILAIKGTSGATLPGGGSEETAVSDKLNDNLLFSCCCARLGYTWTTVCDCYSKTYTCNQDCLEKELMRQDRYYQAVLDVYRNVTDHYKGVPVWVTGHLLGGALALLLARTYGLPAVLFQAPGEMLATKRLHLPMPPGLAPHMEHVWHVGHTADPIYMGVCNGALLSCNAGGYAMETACHTGLQCVYDVVTDLGWRVNLLNHRIRTVIDGVIKVYNSTPECVPQPPCRDCFNWRFISSDDDIPDEPPLPNPLKPHKPAPTTSTTTATTTSSTEAAPTSSVPPKCLERNWYGWCTRWDTDDDNIGPSAVTGEYLM